MEDKLDLILKRLDEIESLLHKNTKSTFNSEQMLTVQLSAEQMWKDFGINIAANVVGNTVGIPTLINLKR